MKTILIFFILILQTQQLFSQKAGSICPKQPCECQTSSYNTKKFIKARYWSEWCIKANTDKLLKPKTWFYRGLIYQKLYENYDSLYDPAKNRFLNSLTGNDAKIYFGDISKDSTLVISIESYLRFFCLNVKNDSVIIERIINDSIYRLHIIERFKTFEFNNKRYQAKFRDVILPQILDYLENGVVSNWAKAGIYKEIFKGIDENK